MERGLLPPLAVVDSRVTGTTGARSSHWLESCGLVSHGPASHGMALLPALVLAVLLLFADPLVAQDDFTRDGGDAAGAIDPQVRSSSSGWRMRVRCCLDPAHCGRLRFMIFPRNRCASCASIAVSASG